MHCDHNDTLQAFQKNPSIHLLCHILLHGVKGSLESIPSQDNSGTITLIHTKSKPQPKRCEENMLTTKSWFQKIMILFVFYIVFEQC